MIIKYVIRDFFKRLAGLDKPTAATWSEWNVWKTKTKQKHPFRYWLGETVPHIINTWLMHLTNGLYWFKYRFQNKHKYHLIDTKLKPGYYDIDFRLLHGVMSLVVDYVEREHQTTDPESWSYWPSVVECAIKDKNKRNELVNANIEETLEHNLMPSNQINAILTVNDVYHWWKNVYPFRKENKSTVCSEDTDPLKLFFEDDSECCDFSLRLSEEYKVRQVVKELWYEEEQYMLRRIIELRRDLWT